MEKISRTTGGGCVVLADSHQNMLQAVRGLLEAMFEAVVMVADKISLFTTIVSYLRCTPKRNLNIHEICSSVAVLTMRRN